MASSSSSMNARERRTKLNDYESMLVRGTCNVALSLKIFSPTPPDDDDDDDSGGCDLILLESLQKAWKRCVNRYDLLRIKVFENTKEMGTLGPKYKAAFLNDDDDDDDNTSELFRVVLVKEDNKDIVPDKKSLQKRLQKAGCSLLDPSKGSYAVEGYLWPPSATTATTTTGDDSDDGSSTTNCYYSLELILSLSHAVSDGPGALRLANAFLKDLGAVLEETTVGDTKTTTTTTTETSSSSQPLIDLQAKILGTNYGSKRERQEDAYNDEIKSYQEGIKNETASSPSFRRFLPPEAMQGIPSESSSSSDAEDDVVGCIDFVPIVLSQTETKQLRDGCRSAGATIQGAISAASLVTRIQMLEMIADDATTSKEENNGEDDDDYDSIHCVIQVPMNARTLAAAIVGDDQEAEAASGLASACLCGSAGVVHAVDIPRTAVGVANQERSSSSLLLPLAKECTQRMRYEMDDKRRQPVEWLYRLMNDPASLPPYSLMASSVGVAPIQTTYGSGSGSGDDKSPPTIQVSECLFFGAALDTRSKAQGTMIHAITFDGELQVAMNFTSPGIQRAFMEKSAEIFKSTLLDMIEESIQQ